MKQLYVIGWPIKHSRSPLIHNHWIAQHKIDANYKKLEVNPNALNEFLTTITPETCYGFNITIPHKESVFKQVNNRDILVDKLSATNCISWQDDKLYASNTDGYGFFKNLSQKSGWAAIDKPVIIYGAGGAARAILQVMHDKGAKNIYLYNRTQARAKKLLDDLNIKATVLTTETELETILKKVGLFINTTSLGMVSNDDVNIDLSLVPKDAVIADIVYTPLMTGLLKQAQQQGLTYVDGLGMLLHQAAKAFEIWFGILPQVDEQLVKIILKDLSE